MEWVENLRFSFHVYRDHRCVRSHRRDSHRNFMKKFMKNFLKISWKVQVYEVFMNFYACFSWKLHEHFHEISVVILVFFFNCCCFFEFPQKNLSIFKKYEIFIKKLWNFHEKNLNFHENMKEVNHEVLHTCKIHQRLDAGTFRFVIQ
jgi:hypothetical protein